MNAPKPHVALTAAVACIAAAKLAVHLYAGRHYGYFVDELYYFACSRHLDWGYVDQPPLIAGITWIARSLFGQSLPAIRLFPALAGPIEVVLTALIARELGGNRYAQGLAALAVLVAPGILTGNNMLTMNAFEPLFWLGCAWLLLRIVNTGDQRLWIWFGMLAGFGLENKYSMGLFGGALVAGLVLAGPRKCFASRWIWIGGALAFLIFLPNLVWNVAHHFPFLELQANIRASGRDVALSPAAFFGEEALAMHPLNVPIWLAGLWFFFTRIGKQYRALGWAWVLTALAIVILSPRIYYLFPAFPLLFAAGSVMWERWVARWPRAVRFAWPVLMAATGVVLAPLAIPVLPPESYVAYAEALHLAQPAIETHELGPLPQLFADQFGWEEMAAEVSRVYHSLPPEVQAKTAIFGQNYGQAGAIDLYGPALGLPAAISGHQSYFLWGPRDYTGESIIVMNGQQEDLDRRCTTATKVGRVSHPYSMPYERFDIYYCQGLKQDLRTLWPQVKRWQ